MRAGVRMFDAPETAKERTPTAAVRRLHRGQRRVIRRRRQRMTELRHLFQSSGLLVEVGKDALAQKRGEQHPDPWTLRAAALQRALTGPELARALGHFARHRGFRSNAKRDAAANSADETSKMKKGIAAIARFVGSPPRNLAIPNPLLCRKLIRLQPLSRCSRTTQ
jgi:CRISPR-associated endonuclease Csn1